MSWTQRKDEYQALARSIDPSIRLVTKDSWPWKVMGALAMVLTFGGVRYRQFLEDFATTIGPIQGYPRHWPTLEARLIVHEARHTRQARWCGLWIHPWVGLPLFGVLYLLIFLPLGFAFFRWRFEIDAERASYRWMLQSGQYAPEDVRQRAQNFGETVCSGSYGWSWIGGTRAFLRAAEAEIERSRLSRRG